MVELLSSEEARLWVEESPFGSEGWENLSETNRRQLWLLAMGDTASTPMSMNGWENFVTFGVGVDSIGVEMHLLEGVDDADAVLAEETDDEFISWLIESDNIEVMESWFTVHSGLVELKCRSLIPMDEL